MTRPAPSAARAETRSEPAGRLGLRRASLVSPGFMEAYEHNVQSRSDGRDESEFRCEMLD
jgi:hypothetical protein